MSTWYYIVCVCVQCADKDLIQRLSGERQHPETGRMFQSEKLNAVKKETHRKSNDTEEDEEPEDLDEEVLEMHIKYFRNSAYKNNFMYLFKMEEMELDIDMITQLVRVKENYPENVNSRIMLYKNIMLRPLEVRTLILSSLKYSSVHTTTGKDY